MRECITLNKVITRPLVQFRCLFLLFGRYSIYTTHDLVNQISAGIIDLLSHSDWRTLILHYIYHIYCQWKTFERYAHTKVHYYPYNFKCLLKLFFKLLGWLSPHKAKVWGCSMPHTSRFNLIPEGRPIFIAFDPDLCANMDPIYCKTMTKGFTYRFGVQFSAEKGYLIHFDDKL